MQCYLQSMLLQQPQQADSTSDTSSPVGRGWSTPQRLLVRRDSRPLLCVDGVSLCVLWWGEQ